MRIWTTRWLQRRSFSRLRIQRLSRSGWHSFKTDHSELEPHFARAWDMRTAFILDIQVPGVYIDIYRSHACRCDNTYSPAHMFSSKKSCWHKIANAGNAAAATVRRVTRSNTISYMRRTLALLLGIWRSSAMCMHIRSLTLWGQLRANPFNGGLDGHQR